MDKTTTTCACPTRQDCQCTEAYEAPNDELPIKLWVGGEYLGEFKDAGTAEDAVFDNLFDNRMLERACLPLEERS